MGDGLSRSRYRKTKNPALIPRGVYCYDENGKCPYWRLKKNLPEQENGYCSFLRESDYDRNEKMGMVKWISKDGVSYTEPHLIPISLIWDSCKECNINDEIDDEINI